MRYLFLLLFASLTTLCSAQGKIPVRVILSGDDSVAMGIAFELKESVRASQSMALLTENSRPHIRVGIASVRLGQRDESSAMSITYAYDGPIVPMNGILITSEVRTCGAEKIQSCSRNILVTIDNAAELLSTNAKPLHEALTAPYDPNPKRATTKSK